jgi:hypothetical protein
VILPSFLVTADPRLPLVVYRHALRKLVHRDGDVIVGNVVVSFAVVVVVIVVAVGSDGTTSIHLVAARTHCAHPPSYLCHHCTHTLHHICTTTVPTNLDKRVDVRHVDSFDDVR